VAEVIVTSDIAGEAARQFLGASPRTVVLAGGQTPRAAYERLATLDYEWSETEFYFGDERCVPATDAASNYRMAWEALLSKVPAAVHRMPGETCEAESYERLLRQKFGPGVPDFDLVFLGLGEDGHTASLFPGSPALTERMRLVVPVSRPDHSRLTMTLPILCAAKTVIFLISGRGKRPALRQLLDGDDIPAAHVRARRVLIVADEDAAGNGAG
jgi:6-phosphogluconolactonase